MDLDLTVVSWIVDLLGMSGERLDIHRVGLVGGFARNRPIVLIQMGMVLCRRRFAGSSEDFSLFDTALRFHSGNMVKTQIDILTPDVVTEVLKDLKPTLAEAMRRKFEGSAAKAQKAAREAGPFWSEKCKRPQDDCAKMEKSYRIRSSWNSLRCANM